MDDSVFNHLPDDILLRIILFLPQRWWYNLRQVNKRLNIICMDKSIFRYSNFCCAFGLSETMLAEYTRCGGLYVETLNLNHCYWLTSTALSTCVSRCRNLHHLFLLNTKITVKGLCKIISTIPGIQSLAVSINDILEFTREIKSIEVVQTGLRNLEHFWIHFIEDPPHNVPTYLSFHVSQQTTLFEYCPSLQSFHVLGQPGSSYLISKQLIQPLIIKKEHLTNLKVLSINSTNDATARMFFFGILMVALEKGVQLQLLRVPGLSLNTFTRKKEFLHTLQTSMANIEEIDFSKVHWDGLDNGLSFECAARLRSLNLSEMREEKLDLSRFTACSSLTSLNLRGKIQPLGYRIWTQEVLDSLRSLVTSCRHLQHLNLSGIHDHSSRGQQNIVSVICAGNIRLKSLSLVTCGLATDQSKQTREQDAKQAIQIGNKRLRVGATAWSSAAVPSTSSATSGCGALEVESSDKETQGDLGRLVTACPDLTHLEIINVGFTNSVLHMYQNPKKSIYEPCKESYDLNDLQIVLLSKLKNLQYLQLTGLPGVRSSQSLMVIGEACQQLQKLSLAYLGLAGVSNITSSLWKALPCFKNSLKDLRIEQPNLKLDELFFESCRNLQCLERLCVISKNTTIKQAPIEKFVGEVPLLHMIHLFTDSPYNLCDKIQSSLNKRYVTERPGFTAVIFPLQHDRLPQVLVDIQLNHLQEMTLLNSLVCSEKV
ncbi:hypothetical protein ACJMK2_023762 [Sinanodonta woodiana]|uniref:F-box domain-containing protein n=1 Tax=Sinanodonta woodiana TaxID=1069815 RepID=A0ABD3T590_SINWO